MPEKQNNEIKITLTNGSVRDYHAPITGLEIAASISKSLEKQAVAIKINGILKDLSTKINSDAKAEIITADTTEGLDIIRHDAAHILAEAVKELYPETQVTIGPTIENGFYYDFSRPTPFTPEDLEKIELQMRKITARNEKIERKVVTKDTAIDYFSKLGEKYKVEIIQELPADEEISIYSQGDFADLCRGPHSPSTGKVKAFKLMKIAGAYWRGNSNNEMLQRIYGTAWASQEQQDAYLKQLEEAEKRDHRKIGREMDLFHFQEEAPGAVFWHPKGWRLFLTLVNYMRRRQNAAGYKEISTPEILDRSLWEKSGHWAKYSENMFITEPFDEKKVYALKPMNCPGCVQIFKHGLKSYRDLPIRFGEFGKVHRYEASGALHGLMRVRAFTQDDAHIFCTPDQLLEESKIVCDLVQTIYRDFGFDEINIKFSDRPTNRIGSDEIWDIAEKALLDSMEYAGIKYTLNPGDGAFYGPKLDFHLRDAIGREWQLGTLQVDLNLPERLGAHFIDVHGNKQQPIILHRALFGSIERFIGILLEHHAGKLPLWLAPIQIAIATITNTADEYAKHIKSLLDKEGLRTELDLDNEKISYKVRKHSLAKTPIFLAIGKNEQENKTVSVRKVGSENQEILDLSDFINKVKEEAKEPF